MKIRFLTLTLVALFAITAVHAQKPDREQQNMQPRDRMNRNEMMAESFNNFFTKEQQEQVKSIRLETAKQVQPLRNELRELQAHQQTLSTSDKPDMKAIYQNIDEMTEVQGNIRKIMAKQQQDIRSLLTDEQKLKFDAMKNRMTDRKRDGFRTHRRPGEKAG